MIALLAALFHVMAFPMLVVIICLAGFIYVFKDEKPQPPRR